ncbi:hypothetical protein chiPu_0011625 [Chiloscyllium punctatum]|uniref:Uncharacterized protein n=1 Tax=Chiloscyllium punctatum TaxID=137246 RepID=A0A401SRY0_CHIPU|nr:hypothetical protein [Chiloscyllium punctatum]
MVSVSGYNPSPSASLGLAYRSVNIVNPSGKARFLVIVDQAQHLFCVIHRALRSVLPRLKNRPQFWLHFREMRGIDKVQLQKETLEKN